MEIVVYGKSKYMFMFKTDPGENHVIHQDEDVGPYTQGKSVMLTIKQSLVIFLDQCWTLLYSYILYHMFAQAVTLETKWVWKVTMYMSL